MRNSLLDVIRNLREELGGNFVIGVDSASRLLGLSPNSGLPLTILSTEPVEISTPDVEVVVVDNINLTNSRIIYGVTVTGIEQTICDMLLYDRNSQTIVEALCYYYYSVGEEESWGNLPQIAEEYGVLEELESYMDDAIDHALN